MNGWKKRMKIITTTTENSAHIKNQKKVDECDPWEPKTGGCKLNFFFVFLSLKFFFSFPFRKQNKLYYYCIGVYMRCFAPVCIYCTYM